MFIEKNKMNSDYDIKIKAIIEGIEGDFSESKIYKKNKNLFSQNNPFLNSNENNGNNENQGNNINPFI